MKKSFKLLVIMIAVFALSTAYALAGEGCTSGKTETTAKTASSKICSPEEIAACAKAKNISEEECAKLCAEGKIIKHTVAIEGMTCGGCESTITKALKELDGVVHVLSVSHKDGQAVVCIDASKCKNESLIKAVTSKGYKAEIIPAVAKSDAKSGSMDMKSCSKTCSEKEKAACAAKKDKEKDKEKDDGSK